MAVSSPPKTAPATGTTAQQPNKAAAKPPATAPAKTLTQPKPQSNKSSGAANTTAEPVGPFRILLLSWPMRMDKTTGQLALLSDVTEEKIDGNYCYFTGKYTTFAEAEKMLPEFRNLGFRTASIVSTR